MTQTHRTTYNRVAIILHWLMAILLITMLLFGEDMMEAGREHAENAGASDALWLTNLHINLGAAIMILTIIRLAWRLANPPPPMPASVKQWEQRAAGLVYGLFYILMIGLPITGWFALPAFLAKHPELADLSLFGLTAYPVAPALPIKIVILHKLGSKVALALLALHVLAALKHQFIDDSKIFSRMMPHG